MGVWKETMNKFEETKCTERSVVSFLPRVSSVHFPFPAFDFLLDDPCLSSIFILDTLRARGAKEELFSLFSSNLNQKLLWLRIYVCLEPHTVSFRLISLIYKQIGIRHELKDSFSESSSASSCYLIQQKTIHRKHSSTSNTKLYTWNSPKWR